MSREDPVDTGPEGLPAQSGSASLPTVQPEPGESGSGTSPPERGSATRRQQIRARSSAALQKVEDKAPPSIGGRMHAFRERIRARRSLNTAWRIMVLALGLTLLVAGAVMFLIPGPGFATIILALVILGSEFTWATRALNPVKEAARRAAEAAMDPRRRRRNVIIGSVLGVVLGVAVGWYLLTYGVTIAPIMDLVNVIF